MHTYHIDALPPQHVREVCDLGVILDSKLTFLALINSTVNKTNGALGALFLSFQTGLPSKRFDQKVLLTSYYSNAGSIL